MAIPEAEHIWFDGKLIKWQDATVHVLTHSLHYGNAVFEGVRAYQTPKGLAIFKLKEHTKRLFESAKACAITIPFTQDEINKAHIDLLKSNTYNSNVYIRPLVFLGYGKMGVSHIGCPVNVAIAAWQWGAYMGEDALQNGIKVTISSWIKPAPFSMMAKAKASANYFNSQMANYEAQLSGYDEALLLDPQGFIAEGSGECFFIVKDGVIITPPNDTSLESITQKTVIEIAKDLGYTVVRQRITRDEAYTADETFFTGTAAEVTPISNIDGRTIGSGKRGEIATKLQAAYFDVVMGKNAKYEHFITYIN
ncbi:branched-chain amino acid aminotransferase [Campylobacter fetus subsp. testudinum]|uniref:Branched-chain-amino-acid aminotransferase n=1 Tax=Campylobacter fetus subsp. testudinum TaxID=1507806 RepID=A0AAX0HBU9_CAMFE|nr:branched-chain amino acid transaminase [Campylobacter fetus]AVK80570.1 branched-chain amino acid transaminase [Campylobacter fetus subsp. testudinum]MPB72812.1 branched-chain amino acid transaminase [Campylobacter fetus]MPB76895.1 branched-chain amino acid transaminase [Campylobacter fetus]OCR87709.1 branched-chain amino acid aminotransferase [Campylobacter fetus subsp. testudinum]OCR89556.1 branched-chain amino acid aminotransferase [Campylobacter fetus subsp. testudinum]